MSFLVRWFGDEPRMEDPTAGVKKVREAIAQATLDSESAGMTKAEYRPRTNYMLPHELGHPVAGVTCYAAAKKLHDHYEKHTEERKKRGKEVL